jgi:outer membrane protein OmpA-like peptidoglycan-associated protein
MMTTASREANQPAGVASSKGTAKAVCRPQMQADISQAFALRTGAIQRTCACGGGAPVEDEPLRRTVQTSLRLSGPGDPSELEARRVADQVMRSSELRVQPLNTMRVASGAPPIGRLCDSCATADGELSSIVARGIGDGGHALDQGTRAFMELRFGHSFGDVRVHTSTAAAESAHSLDALAYTVGNDIVFGSGRYSPESNSGRYLLAHELTHTIQQNAGGHPARACLQRAPAEDCGEPNVKDEGLNCTGKEHDGRGVTVPTAAGNGWELRNFDVDKHFLKGAHEDALDDIADKLEDFLKANPDERVHLLGEASTTAGDCYNMRLSRRRTRCVAAALEARGIKASVLDLDWVGDRRSTARLAAKPAPTARDIENPDDRRVTISINVPPSECSIEAKLRSSQRLAFRFGCMGTNKVSIVVANRDSSPEIYREFVWEKIAGIPEDCDFFPDLDPTVTFTRLMKPVRLAFSEDTDAPSDFKSPMLQISQSAGPFTDPVSMLEFETNDDLALVDFWGSWNPASCQTRVATGQGLGTIGVLRPAGPVRCGPMPTPPSTKCPIPTEEECPKERRESSASHLKAKLTPVSGIKDKVIDWLTGKVVEGMEIRYLDIGTAKTDAEKKSSGDDIWRRYRFVSKRAHGPEGCEQRAEEESARGEAKLTDPAALDGVNVRPATLTRNPNSNAETLWIVGLGRFEMFGEKCIPGGTEILAGSIIAAGGVRCEPLEMDAIPAEKSCQDECPESRRTCTADTFLFRFGRMAPDSVPAELRDALEGIGCDAEVARVNIGAVSTHPIWRPFFWIQPTRGCPFSIEQTSLAGGGGKLTVGVKPKIKLLPPKIGVAPVFDTDGLQLSKENPDDPLSASDFTMNTSVGGMALTGSHTKTDLGLSGLTRTRYQMATAGSPVSFKGSCHSSDGGLLIPAGAVECGLPPSPAHDPAPVDTCPSDTATMINNLAFFASNYNMLDKLHNHPGIVTPLVLQRSLVYRRGEVVKEARFIGLTFTAGTEVEPVVVVFDMGVDDVITEPTKVTLKFTVLSEPCTYLWGASRAPFRLNSTTCGESITQGQSYSISSDFTPTPSGP